MKNFKTKAFKLNNMNIYYIKLYFNFILLRTSFINKTSILLIINAF